MEIHTAIIFSKQIIRVCRDRRIFFFFFFHSSRISCLIFFNIGCSTSFGPGVVFLSLARMLYYNERYCTIAIEIMLNSSSVTLLSFKAFRTRSLILSRFVDIIKLKQFLMFWNFRLKFLAHCSDVATEEIPKRPTMLPRGMLATTLTPLKAVSRLALWEIVFAFLCFSATFLQWFNAYHQQIRWYDVLSYGMVWLSFLMHCITNYTQWWTLFQTQSTWTVIPTCWNITLLLY